MADSLPIILAALFVSVAYFVWQLFRTRHTRLPPGPLNLPIIGALHLLAGDKAKKAPHKVLTQLAQKYGGIYSMRLGGVLTVVLTDVHLIRDALKRDEFTARAPLYLTHGIMGGYGLICAEGLLWRDQRKLSIAWLRHLGMVKFQAVTRNTLERRIMVHVNRLTQAISTASAATTTTELDVMPLLHHNLGNVMNDLVFGITYAEDDKTWQYLQHLQEEGVKLIGVSGGVNFLPFLRFLPRNRKIINFILDGKEKTHQIYGRIINETTEQLAARNYELSDNAGLSILELFLRERHLKGEYNARDPIFDDCQLRHVLADLFGAGVDTTLTTLRWILLYIARDTRVQRLVHQEMDHVLPPGEAPGLSHLDRMPYLRACIAEGQRIRSIVPLGLPHGTTSNVELAGYRIPRGAMVLPLQWAVHMNSDIWPEPDLYKPERFYDADRNAFSIPQSNHFMPFQTGKRSCLGDDLAKMLLFLFAANTLYHFELSVAANERDSQPPLDMDGICGLTLAPPAHKFRIRRRNNDESVE